MKLKKLLTPNKAALLFFIVFLLLIAMHLWKEGNTGRFEQSGITGPVTWENSFPYSGDDSLPYRQFEKIQDSLQKENNRQKILNEGDGSGIKVAFIGISNISECDTCNAFDHGPEENKYYLLLPGYFLRDRYDSEFIFKKGEYYVKHPVWDKVYDDSRFGHYEMKKVPFRFSTDDNATTGSVLIPISRKTYNILSPVLMTLFWMVVIVFLYILFVLPAKVLVRIASGKAFTRKNIRNLTITAWTLLLIPFAIILLQFLLFLLFRRYITNELQLAWLHTFYLCGRIFIAGVVVYLVALAFERGYQLQQEQDLTI